MTLNEIITRASYMSRLLSSGDIPVKIDGLNVDFDFEIETKDNGTVSHANLIPKAGIQSKKWFIWRESVVEDPEHIVVHKFLLIPDEDIFRVKKFDLTKMGLENIESLEEFMALFPQANYEYKKE